jgi:hypothetical protein
MSEEFHAPRVNVIASSEGFSVEVLGRTGLRYVESGRSATIDSEVLAGTAGIWILANSISEWDSSRETDRKIDLSARIRIVDNIRRAFAWRGEKIEITPENWRFE